MKLTWFTIALLGFSISGASQSARKPASPARQSGKAEDTQVYRDATFGFRYEIPYGWVNRTKEMRDEEAPQNVGEGQKPESSSKPSKNSSSAGGVLLAVFERPPDAPGDTVNSAVVIAFESTAAYPGLKKAEEYIAPLTELTAANGFKVEGEPDIAEIDARPLIRVDFSKAVTDKLTMHQSTLVLLAKGQIVSFTFLAGSDDEVDDLIDGLHFSSGTPPKR